MMKRVSPYGAILLIFAGALSARCQTDASVDVGNTAGSANSIAPSAPNVNLPSQLTQTNTTERNLNAVSSVKVGNPSLPNRVPGPISNSAGGSVGIAPRATRGILGTGSSLSGRPAGSVPAKASANGFAKSQASVKQLQVSVEELRKVPEGPSDGGATAEILNRKYDAQSAQFSPSLPDMGFLGPSVWLRKVMELAEKVDPIDAPAIYRAALLNIESAAREGRLSRSRADTMSAEIKDGARALGIKESGVLSLVQEAFLYAARGVEPATKKSVAALQSWDEMLSSRREPFIRQRDAVAKGVMGLLQQALVAIKNRGALPLAPMIERQIIGKGSHVQIALMIQMPDAMPSEVRSIDRGLSMVFALKEAAETDLENTSTPESMRSLIHSKMPVAFGAAYRRLRSEGNGIWASLRLAMVRWAVGKADGFWAEVRVAVGFLEDFLHLSKSVDKSTGSMIRVVQPQPA